MSDLDHARWDFYDFWSKPATLLLLFFTVSISISYIVLTYLWSMRAVMLNVDGELLRYPKPFSPTDFLYTLDLLLKRFQRSTKHEENKATEGTSAKKGISRASEKNQSDINLNFFRFFAGKNGFETD